MKSAGPRALIAIRQNRADHTAPLRQVFKRFRWRRLLCSAPTLSPSRWALEHTSVLDDCTAPSCRRHAADTPPPRSLVSVLAATPSAAPPLCATPRSALPPSSRPSAHRFNAHSICSLNQRCLYSYLLQAATPRTPQPPAIAAVSSASERKPNYTPPFSNKLAPTSFPSTHCSILSNSEPLHHSSELLRHCLEPPTSFLTAPKALTVDRTTRRSSSTSFSTVSSPLTPGCSATLQFSP